MADEVTEKSPRIEFNGGVHFFLWSFTECPRKSFRHVFTNICARQEPDFTRTRTHFNLTYKSYINKIIMKDWTHKSPFHKIVRILKIRASLIILFKVTCVGQKCSYIYIYIYITTVSVIFYFVDIKFQANSFWNIFFKK